MIQQALQFKPNAVVIGDETRYEKVKSALSQTDTKVFAGEKALEEVADFDSYDMMLAGIVGFAGLKPTLKAVEKGKVVGLANKETLVVAGDIVMQKAVENRSPIIPVDSEHSAIFQCLVGEARNKIEKIIEDNCEEIPWEGTEVNKERMAEQLMELINTIINLQS